VSGPRQLLTGLGRLAYPTDHGVTQNWDDQRLLWQHAFDQLNVVHEEHPVLLTEPPLNPRTNRMRCAEIFFEVRRARAWRRKNALTTS
jgi:actin-related protein